jgi:hypothetical protein
VLVIGEYLLGQQNMLIILMKIVVVFPFWVHMLIGRHFLDSGHPWNGKSLGLMPMAKGELGAVWQFGLAYWGALSFWGVFFYVHSLFR